MTIDEVVHGALTLLKNLKFTILNPWLKPHLLSSAVLVRDLAAGQDWGRGWGGDF